MVVSAGPFTVFHCVPPTQFPCVANVTPTRGARPMEVSLTTHRVFPATADFGPPPAPTADRPRPRPSIMPGTFALLVLDP